MTRIYIAGPITGVIGAEVAFRRAAHALREAGYEPVSPYDVQLPADTPWETCMRATTRLLTTCDAVAILLGYQESKGACIEVDWAKGVGLEVRGVNYWVVSARLRGAGDRQAPRGGWVS